MPLSDGLQGWWCPSLDTAGNGTNTLTDLSGNGNNGTLTDMDAATDWVADTDSGGVRALDFDGDNDIIRLGTIAVDNVLQLASGAMSISLWIKPTLSGDLFQRLVDKSDGGNGANGYALYLDAYTYYPSLAFNGNGTQFKADTAPTANVWNHLAVTKVDDSPARFYLNGTELSLSLSTAANIPSAECDLSFASWNHSTAREYTGRMDSLALYNRTLTSDEVSQLYNGGRSLNLLGPPLLVQQSSHTAYIKEFYINELGGVVNQDIASISTIINSSKEQRIIQDSNIPNTTGNPTIKRYLELEAADGYSLKNINNNIIITST